MHNVEEQYLQTVGFSYHDNLTGLFNYGIFSLFLEQEIARANRYDRPFSCAFLGIDNFARYNKKFGRISGDLALKSIGGVIAEEIRASDRAARISGDAFAVLYPETEMKGAVEVTDRIRDGVQEMHKSMITLSAGLISGHSGIKDEADLIEVGTVALAQAKSMGKNTIYCHSEQLPQGISDCDSHILIVDDEPKNLKLLEAMLLPLNHRITKTSNGIEAIQAIRSNDIDIVILDVMMPEMDGFEVCRRIRQNPDTRLTPVILVTALDDAQSKLKGLDAGANDFITKPPNRIDLIARTKSLIKLRRLTRKLTGIENVLFSLARSIEAKDPYTRGHAERVANLAMTIGRRLDLSNDEIEALRYAGYLHDIGKIGTPKEILHKPSKLSDEEYSIVKSHPMVGYNIVLPLQQILGKALDAIHYHHERLDGSGYPDMLKDQEIPLNARIMAVADVYDALTSDRPYRSRMSKEKAISVLQQECSMEKLDKHIVNILIEELNIHDS